MDSTDQFKKLDALDRRILRAVQRQGDLSQAELAEKVATSPASCWRRLKALEADGILLETVRLVDPVKVGKGLDVICQVRMKSHAVDARAQFEKFAHSHDKIMECYSMSGEWDYLVRVIVHDVREYEEFLMRELLPQDSVATSASHFVLKRVKSTTEIPV
ncbi:Lrp/AsnC family transcriptional regulator [Sphingomonas sp. PP-CC-3G-468]|uniref:Lrp/AsnC family transcriptional regulator n=1 Tax=Sphingomonas sp. PP-CC-3G-468 TaxID=2135656 RepID=UPI00104FEFFE|nr:Lrp/AsnC family transcriptional regulator [Sphingomonas sp. PP-CC-3G-468]TCM02927.1 AsnC family transcriptional regulator [Sphingomonas sp. PP-CC-3G-468]